MNRATFLRVSALGLVSFASLAALDGCSPPWGLVRQAPGNPFGASPVFAPLVDFQGLMLDTRHPIPEAEYLAGKTPEQQAAWENDKAQMAAKIMERFAAEARGYAVAAGGPPPAGAFLVSIRVTGIEVGSPFRQAQASMTARLGTPDGQVFDEVNFTYALQQSNNSITAMRNAYGTVSGKMIRMGEGLGKLLARYTRQRLGH